MSKSRFSVLVLLAVTSCAQHDENRRRNDEIYARLNADVPHRGAIAPRWHDSWLASLPLELETRYRRGSFQGAWQRWTPGGESDREWFESLSLAEQVDTKLQFERELTRAFFVDQERLRQERVDEERRRREAIQGISEGLNSIHVPTAGEILLQQNSGKR